MNEAQTREERAALQDLLEKYQSGGATHLETGAYGGLHDTTNKRVTGLKERIAELDRRLARNWPAA
jgi:hypothetical protein